MSSSCNHDHDFDLKEYSSDNILVLYATLAALTVASILCFLKFWGAAITCSHAVQCTAHDSLMDIGVSLINFLTVLALRIDFIKNNFNIKKIASFITLSQGLLILYLTYFLLLDSYARIFSKEFCLHNLNNVIYSTIFSLILNYILVTFQNYVIKETDSVIIKADKIHFQSDFFMNFSVLLGILFVKYFNIYWVDPFLGMICSFYLFIVITPLIIKSFKNLFNIV